MKTENQSKRPKRLNWILILIAIVLPMIALIQMSLWVHAASGSITGEILYYGGAPAGTVNFHIDLFLDLNADPVASIETAAPGPYGFPGLPDGSYYVCAWIENDSPDDNPLTCYDSGSDGQPDAVLISGGSTITDIDIHLDGPWVQANGPYGTGGLVTSLAVHPTISGTVYAGVAPINASRYTGPEAAIYKTTNGARTWTKIFSPSLGIYTMATANSMIYAGAKDYYGGGESILVSENGGISWNVVYTNSRPIYWANTAIDPLNDQIAIMGGSTMDLPGGLEQGIVYKTMNGGLDWTPVFTAPETSQGNFVNAVSIHPVTSTLWLASVLDYENRSSTLYRSEDSGATWPYSVTIADVSITSFDVNTTYPNMLYAGAGQGPYFNGSDPKVYRSSDAGLSWTLVFTQAGGVIFEPPSTVYAVQDSSVYTSTMHGDKGTWMKAGSVTDSGVLAFDANTLASPAHLYAGGYYFGVSKSINQGRSWEVANTNMVMLVNPNDIDLDPQNPQKVLVASRPNGGWKTADGGDTWTKILDGWINTFAIHPNNPAIILSGETACGDGQATIERSVNGGGSFTPVHSPDFFQPNCAGGDQAIESIHFAPSDPSIVYALGDQNPNWAGNELLVLRSQDTGLTWTPVFTVPTYSYSLGDVLAIDPTDELSVFIGGYQCDQEGCEGAVHHSPDGGVNWTQILTTTQAVTSIDIDPRDLDTIYIGSDSWEVWKSTDGGVNWVHIVDDGFLVAVDPVLSGYVYKSGQYYVKESPNQGFSWSASDDPLLQGMPLVQPTSLVIGTAGYTQTLYSGSAGLWIYTRRTPPSHVFLPLVIR